MGYGTVLILDDDEDVLALLTYALKRLGFDVECATHGSDAIEMSRKKRDEGKSYDAAILDLNIPGRMGGKEIISTILELSPKTKAFVSSGYPDDPCMLNFRSYGFFGAIPKPINYEDLVAAFAPIINQE